MKKLWPPLKISLSPTLSLDFRPGSCMPTVNKTKIVRNWDWPLKAVARSFLQLIRTSSAVTVGLAGKDLDLSLPPAQLIASSGFPDSDPFSDFDLFSLLLSGEGLGFESALSGTNFFQVFIRFLAVETTSSSLLDFLKKIEVKIIQQIGTTKSKSFDSDCWITVTKLIE